MRVFEAEMSDEVGLLGKRKIAFLAKESFELEMDSINVILEGLGSSKNTRAFEASDRGSSVIFDNFLWMS